MRLRQVTVALAVVVAVLAVAWLAVAGATLIGQALATPAPCLDPCPSLRP